MKDWDSLRYFLAVAEQGSLSGAASQLGVNHSTVFRRINQLEETMGVRLFERASAYAETDSKEPIGETLERQTLAMLADCPGTGSKRSTEDQQRGVRIIRGAVETPT